MTLDSVRSHQAALQRIVDKNNGTRVSGSPGHDRPADYAEQVFRNAGYQVTRQTFQFQTFIALSPTELTQVSPAPGGPIATAVLSYSGSGDVTAPVTALPGPAADPHRAVPRLRHDRLAEPRVLHLRRRQLRQRRCAGRSGRVGGGAVAYATLQFAMNTEAVNGQRGKGNFSRPAMKDQDHEPTLD